jgi:hypothetical protein
VAPFDRRVIGIGGIVFAVLLASVRVHRAAAAVGQLWPQLRHYD